MSTPPPRDVSDPPHSISHGLWNEARGNRLLAFGAVISITFVIVGIAGIVLVLTPSLRPLYLDQNLSRSLLAPFEEDSLLGTDSLGRELLWYTVGGIGVSLSAAVAVTTFALVVGTMFGVISGYYRGWVDFVIRGLMDLTWSFPIILLAIVLSGVFEPGLPVVMGAVAIILWAGFGRIVRGEVLSLREQEYVKAAVALGVPDRRIFRRHIIPNLVVPILIMGSYYVPLIIIAEAGLSFIGLGAQPPTPSLGVMVAIGRQYLSVSHWMITIPGVALTVIVVGLNALGDGLRDVLDPRQRKTR